MGMRRVCGLMSTFKTPQMSGSKVEPHSTQDRQRPDGVSKSTSSFRYVFDSVNDINSTLSRRINGDYDNPGRYVGKLTPQQGLRRTSRIYGMCTTCFCRFQTCRTAMHQYYCTSVFHAVVTSLTLNLFAKSL